MTYETRVTRLTVLPKGVPTYSEAATHVEIEDEAAGEFVVVRQCSARVKPGEVRIGSEDWSALRDAIDRMIADCREAA